MFYEKRSFLTLSSSPRHESAGRSADHRSSARTTATPEDSPSGSAASCADRGIPQSPVPSTPPAPAVVDLSNVSLCENRRGYFTHQSCKQDSGN